MENKILYHYCSLETLISILKYKTIRLSDVNKHNDSQETKVLANILREALSARLMDSILDDNLILGMARDTALQFIANRTIDQLILNNESLQYVFCLSEDGDMLSQWRGYGDNGKGVSIGFSVECLENLIIRNEDIYLGRIFYINTRNCNVPTLTDILDVMYQQVVTAIGANELDRILTNPVGAHIFDSWERLDIFQKSTLYKNISFEEKREHRIVYNTQTFKQDFVDEFGDEEARFFSVGVQFKSSGTNLVSYLDLSFESVHEDIISKIYLGPNCSADIDDLVLLLKSCGFYESAESIDILPSQSLYKIR